MNVVDTIRETIERRGLIPDGAKIVTGISGGADSVALLHALTHLNHSCTVVHLNHQLRGAESDADEQFVRELAARLDFPFVAKSVDVKAMAAQSGLSVEMAARQARHAFFAEFPDAVIALGHHADDQVETFLLRLARGAGTEGLGGMPY
ncbi:MAG: tRNA lysidine(34) synthetase TilS, partial [Pontiella sp.]|nr:tRNA lysidine(34) synthetase TilS [Pontiella sp.]